jgi:hypothetical protein
MRGNSKKEGVIVENGNPTKRIRRGEDNETTTLSSVEYKPERTRG